MPIKGQGTGTPSGGAAASGSLVEYGGEGTRANPMQFYFSQYVTNYNAASTAFQVLNRNNVVVRIRRITVFLDGSTAAALNTLAFVRFVSGAYSTGGGLTDQFYPQTEVRGFVGSIDTARDGHTWQYDPPLVLIIGASQNWDGHWTGALSVYASGYANSDDMVVQVEGEWFEL